VVVAPLRSVNDKFNGGRHSAASIQRFVKYAYENWQARFVMLFGDGNMDPMNYRRSSGARLGARAAHGRPCRCPNGS
jgi:hypothetical protein